PGNMSWVTGLAGDYTRLGDLLKAQDKPDWPGALSNYREAARFAEDLAAQNPDSISLRRTLAELNAKRAEALVARGNELVNSPEPPQSESLRMLNSALDRYQAAEQGYVGLLTANRPPFHELFEVRINIGDILVRRSKFDDALKAYQSAAALAQTAAA